MEDYSKRFDRLEQLMVLQTKEALNHHEASAFLSLSPSFVYKLAHQRKIPFYKGRDGGKFNYYSKTELTEWMLSRRISTNDELEVEAANYAVTGKFRPATSRAGVKGKSNGHKKTIVS